MKLDIEKLVPLFSRIAEAVGSRTAWDLHCALLENKPGSREMLRKALAATAA